MPRYLVKLSRATTESTAVILDAEHAYDAATKALAAEDTYNWSTDETGDRPHIFDIEEVDAEEPLGIEGGDEPSYAGIAAAMGDETFTDAGGTVWTRPTAWAYAQVCKARQNWQDRAEKCVEALGVAQSVLAATTSDSLYDNAKQIVRDALASVEKTKS